MAALSGLFVGGLDKKALAQLLPFQLSRPLWIMS
jgi:hypothetical protein